MAKKMTKRQMEMKEQAEMAMGDLLLGVEAGTIVRLARFPALNEDALACQMEFEDNSVEEFLVAPSQHEFTGWEVMKTPFTQFPKRSFEYTVGGEQE